MKSPNMDIGCIHELIVDKKGKFCYTEFISNRDFS